MVGSAKRSSSVSAVLAVAAATVLLGACNLLNGSGDIATSSDPGNGLVPDGGRLADGAIIVGGEGGAAGDAGSGDGSTTGPGFIDDAGIDPKVKPCGQNLVCLPDAAGWSPAALLFGGAGAGGGTSGSCPPEYPQATTMQTSGRGGCDCACTPSGGACGGGVGSKSGLACAGTEMPVVGIVAGKCSVVSATLPLPVAFVVEATAPAPTSCGATVNPGLRPPKPATYCTGAVPTAASGGMCNAGEICVKRPGFAFGGFTCIVHEGDIACPSHLPFRTVVGTAVMDGRSCGSTCSCKPQACSGTLEAFSDPACATSVRSVSVDGTTCTTAGADMTGASYRYTPSLGCGVSTPAQVLGSETYTAPRTLCCTMGF
jgi:hypothetical protein